MKFRLLLVCICLIAIFFLQNSLTFQTIGFSPTATLQTSNTTDSCYEVTSEVIVASVGDVVWSQDGSLLAIVSQNDILIYPDGDLSQIPHRLQGHTDQVIDIDVSIDATYLASAGLDGALFIWDLATNTIEQQLPKRDGLSDTIPYLSVQFSPDGQYLAAGTQEEDRAAYIWEVNSWLERGTYLDHYTGVYGIAFNDDSSVLATASGPELRLYDIASGEILYQMTNVDISVHTPHFSEEALFFGAREASSQAEGLVGIYSWDITSDEQPHLVYSASYGAWGSGIDTYADQSDIIAFAGEENSVVIFDFTLMTIIGMFGASEYPLWSINFHPQGEGLVVSSRDDTVRIWSQCQ